VTVREIPISRIVPGKNMRLEGDEGAGELMASLETWGQIQPAMVRPIGKERYELIFGYRRFAAMKARNEPTIACIVREDVSAHDVPIIQLIENAQRKELSAPEYAAAFRALKQRSPLLSHAAIGKLFGKSSSWVAQKIRADGVFGELEADGISELVLEAIPENLLPRLGRPKNGEQRKLATLKAESEKRSPKEYLDPKSLEAKEYRSRLAHRYDYCSGAHVDWGVLAPRNGYHPFIVVCKTPSAYATVAKMLFDIQHGVRPEVAS
jgi:ParB/RepB/Spo0J family partition protein